MKNGCIVLLVVLFVLFLMCSCRSVKYVPVETVDQVISAALCPEASASVREELPVAAFAPLPARENVGDAALRQ